MRQHTVLTPYQFGEAHFYSTEINGELVLFDTGPSTPAAFAFLKEQVDLKRLKYLFITYCHVDHFGLAASIAKESAAEIFIPRNDAIKLRHREERLAQFEKLFVEYGFDIDFAHGLKDWFSEHVWFSVDTEGFKIVEESGVLDKLGITCLSVPGHSQSDLVYLYGDYAITGDILLRGLFPVPLLDMDVENFSSRFVNYAAYCATLLKLQKLHGYKILPGHCRYLTSLNDTIVSYVRRLLKRAGQVKRLNGVESIQEVISKLLGGMPADPVHLYSKTSEIIFMRDFLSEPDKLKHSLEQIGMFEPLADLYVAVAG
jgi:2,4-dienoyl-CoA reductase (NADPH2)